MSNDNDKDDLFTNEDTLVRRAWIDSALDSVRSRLGNTQDRPEPDSEPAEAPADNDRSATACSSRRAGRPKLYVAWSAEERRSGT